MLIAGRGIGHVEGCQEEIQALKGAFRAKARIGSYST